MAVALRGNLKDFAIAEIFQLIGHQRKTGLLEINAPTSRMRVAFDGGALVWAAPVGDDEEGALRDFLARCGLVSSRVLEAKMHEGRASARPLSDLIVSEGLVSHEDIEAVSFLMTQETLFELMGLEGGSFEFLARSISHETPPGQMMVAEQVLMDGMRMQDEWRTFAEELPAEGDILESFGSAEDYCQRLEDGGQGGSERVRLVSALVNGRRSFRDIIDRSRLGTFAAGKIVADLRRVGLLEVASPALRPRRRRTAGMLARVAGVGRLALAAVIPLVLLGMVTAGLFFQSLDSRTAPGRVIAHRPLEEARAQFARQRLHNVLEARRHENGLWPHGLDFLSQGPWGEHEGLTRESVSAYYYMRRGDGIVLLAPRR